MHYLLCIPTSVTKYLRKGSLNHKKAIKVLLPPLPPPGGGGGGGGVSKSICSCWPTFSLV